MNVKITTSSTHVATIDDEILTLNAVYSGVITLDEAADRFRISIDEVNAMLEGYFWATKPKSIAIDADCAEQNEINNPKVFESLFLEYIKLTNANKISKALKNRIIAKLDDMLSAFPFETFPELHSTHFDWDDATRFVLGHMHEDLIMDMIRKLRDEFWKIYSHRMCVIRDVNAMTCKYYGALEVADKRIEDIRDEILEIYSIPMEEGMLYAMRFMHNISNVP